MDRSINWESAVFDDIELVYERAEDDDSVSSVLYELEQMALREIEDYCHLFTVADRQCTREQVRAMSEYDREQLIMLMSALGVEKLDLSIQPAKFTVVFTPHFKSVFGCTMFSLLNRLEKLDGSLSLRGEVTLEMHFPIGGRKGMGKYEIFLMSLYPWLKVVELAYDRPMTAISAAPGAAAPAREKPQQKRHLSGRKIPWLSGSYMSLESVYSRAAESEDTAAVLRELEDLALQESEDYGHLVTKYGIPYTRAQVLALSQSEREDLICVLGKLGIEKLTANSSEGVLVTFSPHFKSVFGCAMFFLLDSLEQVYSGKISGCTLDKLTMTFPLGGRKGMVKYDIFLMSLYNGLQVHEIAMNVPMAELPKAPRVDAPAPAPAPQQKAPEKKKGLFGKLFGK